MSDTASIPLKNWFDAALYQRLAADLAAIARKFDRERFLRLTLDGLEQRELMARLQQTALAFEESVPGSYRAKLATLRTLAPRIGHEFVAIFLSDFVRQFGMGHFDESLAALRDFTRYGSAEFAIRPFIVADQERTLGVMLGWTGDDDEKVRRLASEGCRPRLPWGLRLAALVRDPAPLAPILHALRADPALFVRKSVANNLNDISRDHPVWVLDRFDAWGLSHAGTAWIAKHACRTLIKKGHPRALTLFGFGMPPALQAALSVSPLTLKPGSVLTLTARLTSTARASQTLAIDYVIHYVKASGGTSPKVFKWTTAELPAGGELTLTKRQTIRDFTTRKHYRGAHRTELQINGRRVAETTWMLVGA